jgi:hypothetical protein
MSFQAPEGGSPEHQKKILDDLRTFAREMGVPGACALSKEELVESLRQAAVLKGLMGMAVPAAVQRSGGGRRR